MLRLLPPLAAAALTLRCAAALAAPVVSSPGGTAPVYDLRADCGARLDGSSDDTPALVACAERDNGSPKVIQQPPGTIVTANFVHRYPGVTIRGAGWGRREGARAPMTAYWRPFDPSRPVIQFGDDSGTVMGAAVENVSINCHAAAGGRPGQYGVRFAGGAYAGLLRDVVIGGCSGRGLEFLGGSRAQSSRNLVERFFISANQPGATAIAFDDPRNSGTVFSNDHQLANGAVLATGGALALYARGSQNWLSNVKFDGGEGMVVFERADSRAPGANNIPTIGCANVSFDSASSSDVLVVQRGQPGGDYTGFSGGFPSIASTPAGCHVDGRQMAVRSSTTGAVGRGGSTLTLADASGVHAGSALLVRTGRATFSTRVASLSGRTARLASPAPDGCEGCSVEIGEVVSSQADVVHAAGIALYDAGRRDYYPGGSSLRSGLTCYGASGRGAVAPWNSYGGVCETAGAELNVLQEVRSRAPGAALTRSGGVVTGRLASGSHGLSPGDIVAIDGAREAGFNGSFVVASTPSPATFTYRSDEPGADRATGAVTFTAVKRIIMQGGRLYADQVIGRAGLTIDPATDGAAGFTLHAGEGGPALKRGARGGDEALAGMVASAPASSTSPCAKGQVYADARFIYVCRAPNSWVRSAAGTF